MTEETIKEPESRRPVERLVRLSFEPQHIEIVGPTEVSFPLKANTLGCWTEAAMYCLIQQKTIVCCDHREPFEIRLMDIINAIHPVKPIPVRAHQGCSKVSASVPVSC